MRLSPLQMTDAKTWKGLTTENHLGAIWKAEPQKANSLITMIQQTNFGNDIEGLLSKYPTKFFDNDTDYTWELESQGMDNIPLIEARIDGTAVTAASQAGLNHTEFELVFDKDWFSEGERIVGELNEKYPVRVVSSRADGNYTVYTCELMTGNPAMFIPYEEIVAGKRFSREYNPVERTLHEGGRKVTFKSNVSMRNAFSKIRIQKHTPGNLIGRKMGTYLKDASSGKTFMLWQDYESYRFDREFRQDINRLLMFGTSNRTEAGDYIQKGKSGYQIVEGSGLREQAEASNTSFYNVFSIKKLSARLLDLSEGRLASDARSFMARTGERGAYQFHEELEDHAQLFTPSRETSRIYNTQVDFAKKGMGYGGQFVEFVGPNMTDFKLSIDSMYDNRDRNKRYHANGGVTESYRYDIYDFGTSNEAPNIQKVGVNGKSGEMQHVYIPGFTDPFSPTGSQPRMVVSPKDGWEEHKYYCGGVMVTDPSKTACFIYNED